MKKPNQNFTKLYRYYLRKLTSTYPYIIVILLYAAMIFFSNSTMYNWEKVFHPDKSFVQIFWWFFLIAITQMFLLSFLAATLVFRLSGITKQGFKIRGSRNSAEEINVLLFTPSVTRKTMILAKFAAVATYFFLFNLLILTLIPFLFFLTKTSLMTCLGFLLINGLIFSLINFLLLVPLLFYFYEYFTFGSFCLLIIPQLIFTIIFLIVGVDFVWENLLFLPIIYTVIGIIVGCIFFPLYRKKYLRKDLA